MKGAIFMAHALVQEDIITLMERSTMRAVFLMGTSRIRASSTIKQVISSTAAYSSEGGGTRVSWSKDRHPDMENCMTKMTFCSIEENFGRGRSTVKGKIISSARENIKSFLTEPLSMDRGTSAKHLEMESLGTWGEFKNGIPEGQGTLFFQDGNVSYQGEIYMFSPHGRGKEYREDGTLKYEGDFVKGRRTGTGKEYNKAQVLIYEGGIERDQYQGVGALYTSEGKLIYHGEFREGVPWGHGTEFAEDGITPIYIGKFVDGVRVAADAMDRRYAKEYRKRVVTKQYLIDKANISFIYVIINMIPIKPLSAKKK